MTKVNWKRIAPRSPATERPDPQEPTRFPGRGFLLLPQGHLLGSPLRTAGTSALKQRAQMWPTDYSISLTFQGPYNLHISLFSFIRHGQERSSAQVWKQNINNRAQWERGPLVHGQTQTFHSTAYVMGWEPTYCRLKRTKDSPPLIFKSINYLLPFLSVKTKHFWFPHQRGLVNGWELLKPCIDVQGGTMEQDS